MAFSCKEKLERQWPALASRYYKQTSEIDFSYNCIAWAANCKHRIWDPSVSSSNIYWPSGAPQEDTIPAFIKMFELIGFVVCIDSSFEKGFEKIAIFRDSAGRPKHVARQIGKDKWTSKLGRIDDIEHSEDALDGVFYGHIHTYMKRPLLDGRPCPHP